MKRVLYIILLASVAHISRGSIPIPQPLPAAFADLQKNYPARCDELTAEVRSRISPTADKKISERLLHLDRYRNNLRADILEAKRAFDEPKDSAILPFTLSKICTDLVGFRRSLDALLIESTAVKALTVDEALLAKVRQLWEEEYYFSWRFGSEIAPRPDK